MNTLQLMTASIKTLTQLTFDASGKLGGPGDIIFEFFALPPLPVLDTDDFRFLRLFGCRC